MQPISVWCKKLVAVRSCDQLCIYFKGTAKLKKIDLIVWLIVNSRYRELFNYFMKKKNEWAATGLESVIFSSDNSFFFK